MSGSEAFRRWRGTYGVLAMAVAAVAALLLYYRFHRGSSHNEKLSYELQVALQDLDRDPQAAADHLEGVLRRSSPGDATPWMRLTMGAAWARKARAAQASSPDAAKALSRRAVAAYEELAARHPGHFAAPLALYNAAQILEDLREDLLAANYYTALFDKHGGSVPARLVDERFAVRQLQAKDKEEGKPERTSHEIIRAHLQHQRRRFQEAMAALSRPEEKPPEKTPQ